MPTLIDISLVRDAADNQPAKIVTLLQLCRQSLQSDRAALAALLGQVNAPLALKCKLAHRIHGAARMIGAQTLADTCQFIKVAGEERIDALLSRLLRETVAVEKSITRSIALTKKNMDRPHTLSENWM